jgi:hypothetical protein
VAKSVCVFNNSPGAVQAARMARLPTTARLAGGMAEEARRRSGVEPRAIVAECPYRHVRSGRAGASLVSLFGFTTDEARATRSRVRNDWLVRSIGARLRVRRAFASADAC